MSTQETPVIKLENVETYSAFHFRAPINLELLPGENLIVYGPNGSGKTFLVNTLRSAYRLKCGRITYDFGNDSSLSAYHNIKYVTFQDQYSSSITSMPYQMRWNPGTIDMNFEPQIKDYIEEICKLPQDFTEEMLKTVDFRKISAHTIRSLSSGEFRRFQILHILTKHPKVLIIENPFIGLDKRGRDTVMSLLSTAAKKLDMNIIIAVSKFPECPVGFSHVVLTGGAKVTKLPLGRFLSNPRRDNADVKSGNAQKSVPNTANADIVLQANNISIRYGQRIVLDNLSLTIRQGERWAITGPNGSGKSTLLSLICADNPQAYACDITLFGRKRGSGESIWDIKKNIGFVSPEMFGAWRRNHRVIDVVATGLYDTTGIFVRPKEADYARAAKWLEIFHISNLADKKYLNISSGEQRLVMLCRAFVKEPLLLILDEPFHGLDDDNVLTAKNIIADYISSNPLRTLLMVSHYDTDFPQIISHRIHLERR